MVLQSKDIWWRDILYKLQMRCDLSREETREAWNLLWSEWEKFDLRYLKVGWIPSKLKTVLAMRRIDPMAGLIAPTFLMGLTAKGITRDELMGLVDSFHDHGWFEEYAKFDVPYPNTVYSNGFGGDAVKTINISTAAMIIAAAGGAPCYKMGSRTYFSRAGSHDFLSAVGVQASTTPKHALELLEKVKVAYIDGVATADGQTQELGAGLSMMPGSNQIMKALTYPFRFPILCLNPLKPRISQRGVSMLDTEVPTEVLRDYFPYTERVETIAGMTDDGLIIDEISNVGPTKITELKDGEINTFMTSPEDWGVSKAKKEEIIGDDGPTNARIIVEILMNKRHDAHRDILLINASQFLYLAGIADTRKHGTELARLAIEEGAALQKLKDFVTASGGTSTLLERIISEIG